jgi:multiple sugar transport system permease protein
MMPKTTRAEKLLRYALLILVLFLTIGPFLWQLSTSIKGAGEDIYTRTPSFIPSEPTLANYGSVADTIPVWAYGSNSLLVAFIVVVGNAVGATLVRLRFRGGRLALGLFLATLVLPGEVTIISQYVTIRGLGLADTLLGGGPARRDRHAQRAADAHGFSRDSG